VSEENLRSVNSPSVTGRSGSVGRSLRSVSCDSKGASKQKSAKQLGLSHQGWDESAAAGCQLQERQ
jgi:hypothetical protein